MKWQAASGPHRRPAMDGIYMLNLRLSELHQIDKELHLYTDLHLLTCAN